MTIEGPQIAQRDEEREGRILAVIARRATRLVGLDCDPFARLARLRLAVGQARHGDRWATPEVDLLSEAMEEPVDVACWGMLLLERDGDHMAPGARDDVLRAIVLAAACDAYLRRAARRMRAERRDRGTGVRAR